VPGKESGLGNSIRNVLGVIQPGIEIAICHAQNKYSKTLNSTLSDLDVVQFYMLLCVKMRMET